MKEKNYTIEQLEFLNHVSQKVKDLFLYYPDPSHGIDHIFRVVRWSSKIVEGEKASNPFLCELSAWLHDIGRTREDNPGESSRKHHELSYLILREWFEEDERFSFLNKEEKLELLYAVRYHWNDFADKYDSAWILRDADKMDMFGEVGIKRAWGLMQDDEKAWSQHLRNMYQCYHFVRTKTAKKYIREQNLLEPIDRANEEYLKSKIEVIKL